MIVLRLIHTLMAWLVMTAVTSVLAVVAVVVANLAPNSGLALGVARLWARIGLKVAGARLRITGLDRIDVSKQYIIMCNHESTIDIPAVLVALPSELRMCFLAKKSLFKVPFLGRGMKALGFIPVDRENRASAKHMFETTMKGIEHGRSPLVFPEATRTKDGRMLPFKRGGFLIAIKSGLEILPVGLEGPRIVMPDGSILLTPAAIDVRFGDPIDPADFGVSGRGALTDLCREAIDELRGERGHVRDGD